MIIPILWTMFFSLAYILFNHIYLERYLNVNYRKLLFYELMVFVTLLSLSEEVFRGVYDQYQSIFILL